jgi:hypothetical protein
LSHPGREGIFKKRFSASSPLPDLLSQSDHATRATSRKSGKVDMKPRKDDMRDISKSERSKIGIWRSMKVQQTLKKLMRIWPFE